jgi:uridylate kinase
MNAKQPVYKRILLKLSGEFLQGKLEFGTDVDAINKLGEMISRLMNIGVQIGLVIGGGNFLRGRTLSQTGLDRVTCDQMGMLATVMNGLALQGVFLKDGIRAHVMSPIAIQGFLEVYNRYQAIHYIEENNVLIFVCGTGSPLVSTDSAVSLRAIEIKADVILKATKVDGVYSADPHVHPDAEFFDHLSYQEVIERELQVMDMAAFCLCRDHKMPIRVFNMNTPGIIERIILGSSEGTLID